MTPSKNPKPKAQVDRRAAEELVANGAHLVRHALFQAPTTKANWQQAMVAAVMTAKRLGFTMFEMDVESRMLPRPKKEKEQASPYASTMFFSIRLPGDEWQATEAETASEDADAKMVETPVVTVYALAVE